MHQGETTSTTPTRRPAGHGPRRSRAFAVATLIATTAVLLAGCSGDDGSAPADGVDPTESSSPSTTARTAPEPEVFDGPVEEFYVAPDPLPDGEPGDLVRVQQVSADGTEVTVRVMYLSEDASGRARAVTGVVTHPVAEPPEQGWPIVATAPGTVGLASQCAPSRRGGAAPAFGVQGVRVMTDYIGMADGETQAYLSRASEGHSVLDGARAAQALRGSGAGSQLLVFGHSQGGHGAQSAHELAGSYAPELDLLGTVSVAPAAMFDRTYGGIDDIVSRIVTTMGLYGVATDHPELHPEDYLSDDALRTAEVFDRACLGDIIGAFAGLAISPDYWRADPTTTEPARSVLLANDVGNEAADAPLLLISGTADERVVHERVLDLFDRLCDNGQVTELVVLEGATHDDEVPLAEDRIATWMADRLEGAGPIDSCGSPGEPGEERTDG